MTNRIIIIPDEIISNKIYFIRNQKVMLDKDLAELFETLPLRLRQQVTRNLDKFPEHFMFRLDNIEVEMMIAEKAIMSKQALGGSMPYVFTEHGVLQLANVIKSERATQMSIKIIEVFVSLRDFVIDNLNLKLEVDMIKKKLANHDKNIELVFSYLDELIEKKDNTVERAKIGYKK
jgi:hypothetical protein